MNRIVRQSCLYVLPSLHLYLMDVPFWPVFPVWFYFLQFFPSRRYFLLTFASIGSFFLYGFLLRQPRFLLKTASVFPSFESTAVLIAAALVLLLVFSCICFFKKFSSVKTGPVLLISGVVLICGAISAHTMRVASPELFLTFLYLGMLWPTLCAYLYNLEFSKGVFADLIYFRPVWKLAFFPPMPFFIQTINRDLSFKDDTSSVQWRGVTLLIWALVLRVVAWLFDFLIYHKFHFQPLHELLNGIRTQTIPDFAFAWGCVLFDFLHRLIEISVVGHVVVGLARICGFDLMRNTYSPFRARSLLDFFSRYNFYYKEFLLHLFFYPTFLRIRSAPFVLRVSAAIGSVALGTFTTVFIGFGLSTIVERGFNPTLSFFSGYMIFSLFLAFGLIFSFLLQQNKPERNAGPIEHSLRVSMYFIFFSLIRVFDAPVANGSIHESIRLIRVLFWGV